MNTEKIEMKKFFQTKKKELALTIFNKKTWEENEIYRKENGYKCIYSISLPITSIEKEKGIFVLEGNISENKIKGIGYIINEYYCKKIYEKGIYNQYTYIGNYRIDRDEMTPEEYEIINKLDLLCFYGKSHLKRYSGIKRFPQKWIYNMSKTGYAKEPSSKTQSSDTQNTLPIDILDSIRKMFEIRNNLAKNIEKKNIL